MCLLTLEKRSHVASNHEAHRALSNNNFAFVFILKPGVDLSQISHEDVKSAGCQWRWRMSWGLSNLIQNIQKEIHVLLMQWKERYNSNSVTQIDSGVPGRNCTDSLIRFTPVHQYFKSQRAEITFTSLTHIIFYCTVMSVSCACGELKVKHVTVTL